MRGPILLACLATSMFHALGHAAEFPYVAYVSSDDVYVRSGPGKNYYPTAKLKRGEQVEVYRHDPGGWYAIRPPRQSFSWVSARQLDPAEKRLAVVNTDRAVARVGSVFSEMRDVIQVRLNKGERVELVEAEPVADGKWYKIAPPAGEFRWIHREYLDRQAPLDDVAVDDADEDNDEEESASRRARKLRRTERDIQLASGDSGDSDGDEPREEPRPVRRAKRTADDQPPQRRRPHENAQKTFAEQVADIDLDLSAMVAEELGVWSFADLRARTARLIDQAPTALERGQARLMMSKIDRFAELQERSETIARLRADTQRRNRGLGRTELVRHDESAGPRFDGVGRLMANQPRNLGAPPFVLLDAAGRIVTYVTPAPNINLRSYVDKQVGVNGQRGYIADLQKPHLNAQHVTVLSDVRR